jgi:signal transduction histidine kinase
LDFKAVTQTLLRRTQVAFIWIALVPIVLGVLAWRDNLQYRERAASVSNTRQILREMDDLVLAITSAETGQRGYLLTGDDSYLEPFRTAAPQSEHSLAHLGALIGGTNPDQRARLEELTAAVHLKMDELRNTVELRRTQGEVAAMALVRAGTGQRAMETIRRVALSINAEQAQQLEQLREGAQTAELRSAFYFGAGIVVSMALLFWAWHLITIYAKERMCAEQEADQLNSELEKRVADRTAELAIINSRLLRSNDDLERYAYVASHDLQEPLRMVSTYVDLLARRYEGKLDSAADDYIRFAVDGARRMRLLIDDLLSYARAGIHASRIAPADFEKVLQAALENLQLLREETHAEIVHEPLPVVPGDEAGLVLVMQNLLSNALKFRQPDRPPRVRVAAARHDSEWRFVVEDNGIGFDGEYADKIFEIFQRLHPSSAYPGTGIGLAISKRIIEGHGGRMWAESADGAGSKFWFSLPVVDDKSK